MFEFKIKNFGTGFCTGQHADYNKKDQSFLAANL